MRDTRLSTIGFWALPPKWSPDYKKAVDFLNAHETPEFRKAAERAFKAASATVRAIQANGSGLPLDQLLRYYSAEYNNRAFAHGLHSMPTSFSFAEAFFEYRPGLNYFGLREERDYVLSFMDFFDWFTSDACSGDARDILTHFPEELILSFNTSDLPQSIEFSTANDSFCIAGASLIRHKSEVMVMLLGGLRSEFSKPLAPFDKGVPYPGKEDIGPDPKLVHERVPLEGTTDRQRIIAMTRFDLSARTQPFRYLAFDVGTSFFAHTDDPDTLRSPSEAFAEKAKKIYTAGLENLHENASLFEMCKTVMFLPEYAAQHSEQTILRRYDTRLKEESKKLSVQRKLQFAAATARQVSREVRAIDASTNRSNKILTISTPAFQGSRTGYWKILLPWELGNDREGNPTKGRTWIMLTESGSIVTPPSPAAPINQVAQASTGVDRTGTNYGFVYVLRNPQYDKHVYKVGLTRRTSEERSNELSRATGVADYFAVMEEWEVADCVIAEREIHERLSDVRLTDRREFFKCPYKRIFRTIEDVVERINSAGDRRP